MGLVLLYVVLQRDKSRFVVLAQYAIVVGGLYFIWFPEHADIIAHYVGVGRGTDLIIYCWIVITILLAVNARAKMRRLEREITVLTRSVAIAGARKHGDPQGACTHEP